MVGVRAIGWVFAVLGVAGLGTLFVLLPSLATDSARWLSVANATLLAFFGWGVLACLVPIAERVLSPAPRTMSGPVSGDGDPTASVPITAADVSAAGQVVCPMCGRANAVDATRCHACGVRFLVGV